MNAYQRVASFAFNLMLVSAHASANDVDAKNIIAVQQAMIQELQRKVERLEKLEPKVERLEKIIAANFDLDPQSTSLAASWAGRAISVSKLYRQDHVARADQPLNDEEAYAHCRVWADNTIALHYISPLGVRRITCLLP